MTIKRFFKQIGMIQHDRESVLVRYRENLINHLLQEHRGLLTQEFESSFVPLKLCAYRQTDESHRETIESVLRENRQVLVLGSEGSGKSTLLKYLCLHSSQGLLQNAPNIPVLIQLARYDPSSDLASEILHQIKKYAGISMESEDLIKLFNQARVFLLLDGLNEAIDPDVTVKVISLFAHRFPNTYIVVTSRPYDLDTELRFPIYHIAPMSDADIRRAVDSWISGQPVAAEIVWNTLEENPSLKSLARHPFLLKLLVELYNRESEHPFKTDAILQMHLQDRLQLRAVPLSAQSLAEQMALYMYSRRSHCISYDEIVTLVTDGEIINFDDALAALHKTGLIERQNGLFRFSHQLLREYFCVQSLRGLDTQELKELVNEHMGDPDWEQVLTSLLKQRSDVTDIARDLIVSDRDKASSWLFEAKLLTEGGITADKSLRLQTIQNLCQLLNDESPQETMRATNFLYKLVDKETSDICRDWLVHKSDDPLASASLAFILAAQGHEDEYLYRVLLPKMRADDKKVRYQACRALGAIDSAKSTGWLIDWLQEEKDTQVLQQILSCLSRTHRLPNRVQSADLARLWVELEKLEQATEDPDTRAWADLLTRKLAAKHTKVEV